MSKESQPKVVEENAIDGSIGIVVSSPAFQQGQAIPDKFTCNGENINPEIGLENIPSRTRSLIMILEDKFDQTVDFSHWILWNIPPTSLISENSAPGVKGTNSFGKNDYVGPCPKDGPHKYHFMVYALDATLNLKPGSNKEAVMQAMNNHLLAAGELVGTYG